MPARLLIFKDVLIRLDLSDKQKVIAKKLIEKIDKINTYELKHQYDIPLMDNTPEQ